MFRLRCSQVPLNRRAIVHQIFHRAVLDALAVVDQIIIIGELARHSEILLDEQNGRVRAEMANRFHQLFDQNRPDLDENW